MCLFYGILCCPMDVLFFRSLLSLDVSVQKQHVLPLDMPVLQQSVLPLLRVCSTELCAAAGRVYSTVQHSVPVLPWTFLFHIGCAVTGRVCSTKACSAPERACSKAVCASLERVFSFSSLCCPWRLSTATVLSREVSALKQLVLYLVLYGCKSVRCTCKCTCLITRAFSAPMLSTYAA